MDIISELCKSRAGDRAGFFVVKERSRQREMYPISKGAVGGGACFQAVDLLFFPCSALLFSAELPILRVFFAILQFARPPVQGFTMVGCTPSLRHDN
jgi:hypothetical protein